MKNIKRIITLAISIAILFVLAMPVFAAGEDVAVAAANSVLGDKALAAAIAVGLAAAAGAVGMGIAVAKATEAISRQPEAENKIRTPLMLGLVFVETIYCFTSSAELQSHIPADITIIIHGFSIFSGNSA